MAYSCSIIAKDPKTRGAIENLFLSLPSWKIEFLVEEYDEALNQLLKTSPQLLLMDLDTSIDRTFPFLQELEQYHRAPPRVIGISSTKDFAYEAIKQGLSDYLLKPLNELSLRKAILNFEKKNSDEDIQHLCLQSYSDYHYLLLKSIIFLKADNNTTDIYLKDGKRVTAFKNLKHFEQSLPGNFFRIHNSYMVNISAVQRIHFGRSHIIVKGEDMIDSLPFSRSYRKNVDELRKILSLNDILI